MAETNSSFWGPVTSRYDWCEKNYVRSSYIAEFFNTISNIPGIILAFIGLVNCLRQRFEKRFSMLHISNMILGIGSMLYHASLQNVWGSHRPQSPCLSEQGQQQSDETPMVWEMLLYIYILYSPDWHYRSTIPTFLCLYGALFALVHALCHLGIIFKAHYAALCFLCIPRMYKYYIHTNDATARGLAKRYVATLTLASFFWVLDRVFCIQLSNLPYNPQGHAIWHVLMSLNSYYANTFLMFCRAQQRGWAPKVAHFLGVLPYIKIEKPKSQ